jgi:hypothetical protein
VTSKQGHHQWAPWRHSISDDASCIVESNEGLRDEILNKKTKIIAAVCLGFGTIGLANVAYAGIYNENFNVVAPLAQNGVTTAYQTKTYTGHGTTNDAGTGYVSVASAGSTYKTDAQMCSVGGFICGSGIKVHNLDDHTDAWQYNSYAVGTTQMVGQFQISSLNLATVQITGTYRTDGG